MKDEALKLALEALTIQSDRVTEIGKKREAITAIKQALSDATHMAAPVPDIPDLIAGALGVSRGTAYDLIREALKEAAPVQEQVAAELERIAQEPPVNGNNLAQARVLMAAQRIRNAIPPNVATPLEETASLAAPAPEERKREWVHATPWRGLTDEEIELIFRESSGYGGDDFQSFARAIEAKLKERNT